MSVPAPPSQDRTKEGSLPKFTSPALIAATAVAAGSSAAVAPSAAGGWTAAVAGGSWLCVTAAVLFGSRATRRADRRLRESRDESASLRAQLHQQQGETAQVAAFLLPAVAQKVREGVSATDALASSVPPADPHLRQILQVCATELEAAIRRAAEAQSAQEQTHLQVQEYVAELHRLTQETLPRAVKALQEGSTAETVLAELELPRLPLLREPAEGFVREIARSERRAAAAQAASAKALSRVQAKAVAMLADLRDMQDRHGEEVLGDLLRLDHATSQLGLLTDRLALLMGGRSSRAWNKPIVMESILRGAVGRIAAYQRVRMHCSTRVAVSGYAAEGVMHLLAELMDNAANFSPPIDEVHVYVEERTAGIVVTIEDSGLKMADAAMRRAEQAVSGQTTDLASLQGTRLGLAVVGRIAAKYQISVSFRPSSRGGTGAVVLLPPQLLAQQREPVPQPVTPQTRDLTSLPAAAPRDSAQAATPVAPPASTPAPGTAALHGTEQEARPSTATTLNGLPVRAPGHTMAAAEHDRERRRTSSGTAQQDDGATPQPDRAARRDAGQRFGAFHRGRQSAANDAMADPASTDQPPA